MGWSHRIHRWLRRGTAACGVVVVASLVPSVAWSQCPPGRTAASWTEGHCCWPGQFWSRDDGRCAGVPACPLGRQAQDEDCVPDPSPPAAMGPEAIAPFVEPPGPPRCSESLPLAADTTAARCRTEPGSEYVRVRFVAESAGHAFTVTTDASLGDVSCQTPCAMMLAPGPVTLHITGDAQYDAGLMIPDHPVVARVGHSVRWQTAVAITMVSTAVALGLFGLILTAQDCDDRGVTACDDRRFSGTALLSIGGLLSGVAAYLFATTGHERIVLRIPVTSARAPAWRLAGVAAAPLPGAGGALGLAFSF